RLLLPDPDTPVTTTSLRVGTETSTPFRLWTRTPRATMAAGIATPHSTTPSGKDALGAARLLVVERRGGLLFRLRRAGGFRRRRLAHPGLEGVERRVDLALLADRGELAVQLFALGDRDRVHGRELVRLLLDALRVLVEHADRAVDVVLVRDLLHALLGR